MWISSGNLLLQAKEEVQYSAKVTIGLEFVTLLPL